MEMNADTKEKYIGQSTPRANAKRLLQGRGVYTDDLRLPRLAHLVFFRSPHAHARIVSLNFAAARAMPGVIAVVDGKALAAFCKPWVAVLAHLKGIKSAPQHALAIDRPYACDPRLAAPREAEIDTAPLMPKAIVTALPAPLAPRPPCFTQRGIWLRRLPHFVLRPATGTASNALSRFCRASPSGTCWPAQSSIRRLTAP